MNNLQTPHYIQGGLATLAGAALAVAQFYPAYSTLGHLIAAVAGVALANLGLLSPSATTEPAKPLDLAPLVSAVAGAMKPPSRPSVTTESS